VRLSHRALVFCLSHAVEMAPLVAYQFPPLDGGTLFEVPAGQVNLGVGAPDDGLLEGARAAYAAAVGPALAAPLAQRCFQYGPVQGDGGFLTALAAFLTRQYGEGEPPVVREHLAVTSGASFGLLLACHLFVRAGQPVYMEDPSYFIARDIFRDAGLDLVPLPSDADGLDVEALAAAAAARPRPSAPSSTGFEGLVYVVPTYGNPTGRTLSAARRRRLVELAYRHQLLVVCDDVYNSLRFVEDQRPPPRVVAYDDGGGGAGCVISNGSFSKIFAPGVRLGWIEARPPLLARILASGALASSGSANQLTSGVFRRLLEAGEVDRVLERARTAYAERCAALCDALERSLPPGFALERPRGGFFVWVTGPPGFDADAALARCRAEHNVVFKPGQFSSCTGTFRHCFRLSFAYNPAPELVRAATVIGDVVRKLAP
jgi:2-aminoadipate transaminase